MSLDLKTRVAAIPYWYHRIELPGGVVTPGWAPMSIDSYRVPERFDGLRVLDVGAWDGFWTFEALRRGAREVVAIDDFSDHLDSTLNVPRPKWETFDLCRDALGYGDDRVTRREMSVYDVSPDTLGLFDAVFFFGALYHLRHPLLALDKLASVCKGGLYVESAIVDDFSPYRGFGKGYDGQQMVMEFYPDAQFADNPTNWWAPTLLCLAHMVRIAGFKDITAWKLVDDPPSEVRLCRGFAKGVRA